MKCDCAAVAATSAAVIGAFLIVTALVCTLRYYTRPEPLGEDRAAVRRKTLAEVRTSNAEVLNNYAWQDQSRGVVRLPIEEALRLAESAWHSDPAAARSNLIARAEKAFAPLPKAPEKPSQFE
jgi:hypothetical protein